MIYCICKDLPRLPKEKHVGYLLMAAAYIATITATIGGVVMSISNLYVQK